MSDIITTFLRTRSVRIVSDGDIDGLFATAFLLRSLRNLGFGVSQANIFFPRARERKGLVVKDSIIIELSPRRGLIFSGQNILLDHHPEPPRIELYDETTPIRRRLYNSLNVSVAGLVKHIFGDTCDAPRDLVDAVDYVDFGNLENKTALELYRAFMVSRNIPKREGQEYLVSLQEDLGDPLAYELLKNLERIRVAPVYRYVVVMVVAGLWGEIYRWLESESRRYLNELGNVLRSVYSRSYSDGEVGYFTYYYGNVKERTVAGEVLYLLQKENRVAFYIGITKNGFLVRIASMGLVDLGNLCDVLQNRGVECGGRSDVVGLYYDNRRYTLADVLKDVKILIDRAIELAE